jgi:hypothetical protein
MAVPTNTTQQKYSYPVVVPNMVNQATLEGFLVRAWLHNGFRFLRLANHRLPPEGTQSDGPLTVESDYVTIRLDSCVYFDMTRANPGLRLLVRGRIEGHDIPETIGDILRHCNLNVRLPMEIARLTVSRPAVQIFGASVEFIREKGASNQQQPGRSQHGKHFHRNDRRPNHAQPGSGSKNDPRQQAAPAATPAPAVAVAPAVPVKEAAPSPKGVQPGQDVSEVAAEIDARKASNPSKKGLFKKGGPNVIAARAPKTEKKETKEKKQPKAKKTSK